MTPRRRFVLRFGVLGYGGSLFVLFNVLHVVRLHAHGASLQGLPLWLLLTAVICPVLGYGFGVLAWSRMQRRGR
ncbi:MAG: hypothetical protein ACRYGF_01790 [Janthinobacterium lividum]